MTLKQLEYVITIAKSSSITEAANTLYVSQPSLTKALHELESEMNIKIFNRTNKGISVSKEGEVFLSYARQILEQAEFLSLKYKDNIIKKQFSISTQHYSFVVNAFVDVIKKYGQDEFDFSLRETETYEIIEDVSSMKSEVGILFLNDFNDEVINKLLKDNNLTFHHLKTLKPHVFISKDHPLSHKDIIENKDLDNYPYLSFEQGDHNSLFFSEEIFSKYPRKKNIRVRDRATLFNLLIGLNGYTISSGIIDNKLNGENIISIPLKEDSFMSIGYILNDNKILSDIALNFIESLKKYLI